MNTSVPSYMTNLGCSEVVTKGLVYDNRCLGRSCNLARNIMYSYGGEMLIISMVYCLYQVIRSTQYNEGIACDISLRNAISFHSCLLLVSKAYDNTFGFPESSTDCLQLCLGLAREWFHASAKVFFKDYRVMMESRCSVQSQELRMVSWRSSRNLEYTRGASCKQMT